MKVKRKNRVEKTEENEQGEGQIKGGDECKEKRNKKHGGRENGSQ